MAVFVVQRCGRCGGVVTSAAKRKPNGSWNEHWEARYKGTKFDHDVETVTVHKTDEKASA